MGDLYSEVVSLGGEAIDVLYKTTKSEDEVVKKITTSLIEDIAQETRTRLKLKVANSVCIQCLAYCVAHPIQLSWTETIEYYGCRICKQSQEFVEASNGIVLVLDRTMVEKREAKPNRPLRVNWLSERKVFDFDRVEIICASDEEVERFAVQVGNDTDERRQHQYRKMECLITSERELSANTTRILQSTFGEVKRQIVSSYAV